MKYKLFLNVSDSNVPDEYMASIEVCSIKTPTENKFKVDMNEALNVVKMLSSFVLPELHKYVEMDKISVSEEN